MQKRLSVVMVTLLGGLCVLAATAKGSEVRKATKIVQPTYPELALKMKVQGAVVVEAVVGQDGNVNNVIFVSGPSLLKSASIECVKQWHYAPSDQASLLPVEVDFKLPE